MAYKADKPKPNCFAVIARTPGQKAGLLNLVEHESYHGSTAEAREEAASRAAHRLAASWEPHLSTSRIEVVPTFGSKCDAYNNKGQFD